MPYETDDRIGAIRPSPAMKWPSRQAPISRRCATRAIWTHISRTSSPSAGNGYLSVVRPSSRPSPAMRSVDGCEVAMMCDFIIAADNAKFGQPEIALRLFRGAAALSVSAHRRQGKGHGHVFDRPHDGCGRGGARRSHKPASCRLLTSWDEAVKDGDRHRQVVASAVMMAKEAVKPGLRDHARRGRSIRAPSVPFHLCYGGSERKV